MRSFYAAAAIASATAFVVPARRHALTRRAAHDDGDTITQLIDAKEAELADADAVTTTKTTTTMPNYVEQANYFDGDRPAPAWELAQTNFLKQGATILGQVAESIGLQKRDPGAVPASLGLVLSNEAVTEAERKREASGGRVDAHPVSRKLYDVGCLFLDTLFDERPIQRFWFLEVIARIPYFSYVSMLHLYESFGWWRGPELRKVHNAEEWNELHHLLIMEALGGNSLWSDRFLGYHVAIGYYWILNVVFFFSPRIAYQFMELLEAHAVDTYGTFVVQNRERLAELPAPDVATSYYSSGDLYLFDDFQVSTPPETRRPDCETLLDVFTNIAIDEGEHVKTMQACQDYARIGARVVSPHMDGAHAAESREKWVRWAAEVNEAAKH